MHGYAWILLMQIFIYINHGEMFGYKKYSNSYNKEYMFRYPDIDCEKEQHLLINGPSGCGKTILLHLLSGLIKPKQGTIQVNNTDITMLDNKKQNRFRGRKIGIVFQHFCFKNR